MNITGNTITHFCSRPELLLDALVCPIPRNVYDTVVSYPDLDAILEVLKERRSLRDCVNTGKVPSSDFYRETQPSLKHVCASQILLMSYV